MRFVAGSGRLAGDQFDGGSPPVVLLHAGVNDRRSWPGVIDRLNRERRRLVTYDRRGFGETPPASAAFSHATDLIEVLDELAIERAVLVGSSAGGGIALEAALRAPDRVAGLLLISPGRIGGAPQPELEEHERQLDEAIERAVGARDLDTANQLEARLWLDGPAEHEGRVAGTARDLFLAMNKIVLTHESEAAEAEQTDTDCWARVDELRVATIVACGDRDLGYFQALSEALARRIPGAQHRVLPGVAHLPQLEAPAMVAELIGETLELTQRPKPG